ncbi:MAG: radical SAM protein [Planctomycetes bacterium]|nr:radical SAM protein [Planctomycetota bacterium]
MTTVVASPPASIAARLPLLARIARAMWRADREANYFPGVEEMGEVISDDDLARALAACAADSPARAWSVFVHVPFCRTQCAFCCLETRVARDDAEYAAFVDLAAAEIGRYGAALGRPPVSDLFLAGGTPTQLPTGQLRRLLEAINLAVARTDDFFFTAEGNPESVDGDKAALLRAHGLARLSMGVQSLDGAVLRAVGRAYQTEAMVAGAMEAARGAGVPWINLDLVCGLPEESDESFAASLAGVIGFAPESVVICPWAPTPSRLWREGRRPDPAALAEDQERRQRAAAATLAASGYTVIPTPQSLVAVDERKVPRGWWQRASKAGVYRAGACLGVGFGATSRLPGRLCFRHHDEESRAAALRAGRWPPVLARRLEGDTEARDFLVTRLSEGFELAEFRERFGGDPVERFAEEFDYLIGAGKVAAENGRVEPRFADELECATLSKLFYSAAEVEAVARRFLAAPDPLPVAATRGTPPYARGHAVRENADMEALLERGRRLWAVMARLDKEPDYFPLYDEMGEPREGAEALSAWRAFAARAARESAVNRFSVMAHIPFCRTKCLFCMFDSVTAATPHERGAVDQYLEHVCREIRLFAPILANVPLHSLYFGGGTPSYLEAGELERLLAALAAAFTREEGFHFACEVNPDNLTAQKLAVLRQHGISRLSIGVQSNTASVLRRMNRGYQKFEQVRAAVALARAAGVPAVSLDTVAGLPEETEASFADSLAQCLDLGADSVVVYPWYVTPTPYFHLGLRLDRSAHRALMDRMVARAENLAHRAGYRRRPGVVTPVFIRAAAQGEALVNRFDVEREEGADACLGLGPYGHSHVFGALAYKPRDHASWTEALEQGRAPPILARRMDEAAERRRYMIGNLYNGVDGDRFRRLFGMEPGEAFPEEVRFLSRENTLRGHGGRLTLAATPDEEFAARAMLFLSPEERAGVERVFLSPRGQQAVASGLFNHGRQQEDDGVLSLRLSAACNNACASCPPPRPEGADVPDEEAAVAALRAGREAGASRVVFTGCGESGAGEPTLHPHFLRVVAAAARLGFSGIEARTNGRMFAYRRFAQAARRAGLCHARVRFFGDTPAVHDAAAGVAGAFVQALAGVENLVAVGLGGGVEIADHRRAANIAEFLTAIRRFAALGVRRFLCERHADAPRREFPELHHLAEARGLQVRVTDREAAP